MRDAVKTLMLAGLAGALAACGDSGSQDQNFAIDNVAAPADVEALPPDESSATPTNALVNGTTDDADVPTADNQTDSY